MSDHDKETADFVMPVADFQDDKAALEKPRRLPPPAMMCAN